ncbi:MAG TPA: NAD(P)H-hydrate dehydratase, partial [bacterium]|nr:NAD(P)H-hydrate dehydratase [bacterium]
MNIAREIKKKWKPRKTGSHKGNFGRIFILAGSRGLTGAAHLAGMGALRAGAGLVTVGVPEQVYPVIARRQAELMVRPFPSTSQGTLSPGGLKSILEFSIHQDVLAIGPGLSQNRATQRLIRQLIEKTVQPLVLDADGLNALKGRTSALRHAKYRAILTPHPGEFIRLFGGRLSGRDHDRKQRAREVAFKFKIFLVLKGHHTVIASPEGKVHVNPTGNPGMASGGTGDVLTGIIAALIGQRFSLWDAARFGVYFHGLAGDLACRRAGEASLTATDLLEFLPQAVKKV